MVRDDSDRFDRDRRPEIENRRLYINNYYGQRYYHDYYHRYWRHGFYGGYYYPFYPCDDIDDYFYYPMVFWFYEAEWDDYYWQTWYGDDTVYYPQPFPYVGVYYPTVTFRDLAVEASAWPSPVQRNFRTAMINLTQALVQQLADQLGQSLTLRKNEITVTHYENLQNQAIVMEGSVDLDRDGQGLHVHSPFKALLDLNDPGQTLVYVPTTANPTDADLYTLNSINQRISALGGDPFAADAEPQNLNGADK